MKKTNKFAIIVSWILVIGIILLIFYFSSQNVKDSNNTSDNFISNTIGGINNGEVLDNLESKYTHDNLSQFIRNMAHFFEYSLLGLALFNALYLTLAKRKYVHWIISLISALVIAIIDEIHQGFVGRNSNALDVCIDFLGALLGASLLFVLYHLIEKHKNKKKLKFNKI